MSLQSQTQQELLGREVRLHPKQDYAPWREQVRRPERLEGQTGRITTWHFRSDEFAEVSIQVGKKLRYAWFHISELELVA